MRMTSLSTMMALLALLTPPALRAESVVVDFEDLNLPPGSHDNGSDGSGGFTSHGAFFHNEYSTTYQSWTGWAISSEGDTTTPGYQNQYSSFTGGGMGGSGAFGVAFVEGQVDPAPDFISSYVNLPSASFPVQSIHAGITNTTYTALSMKEGDPFAGDPYGGLDGNREDFLKLSIIAFTGPDATGTAINSVDFYLADFRFDDNALDYIVDEWTMVDLSSLIGARSLGFRFDSSRTTEYFGFTYIDTPTYFAMDNLTLSSTAMPEPSSLAMVALGLLGAGGLAVRRSRRSRHQAV